jgi:hypothetical protein
MQEQVKRGRGRPRKVAVKVANNIEPKKEDALLFEINLKFLDTYGFQLTETQAKAFLLHMVRVVEL